MKYYINKKKIHITEDGKIYHCGKSRLPEDKEIEEQHLYINDSYCKECSVLILGGVEVPDDWFD